MMEQKQNPVTSINFFIEFLDSKIKLYEAFREILYKQIDTVHNSPENLVIFNTLHEISIRLDELFQLKTRLE